MKSFFKKLSLVLAAAMVITMLPLQGAKAATAITVGLSGKAENPNPSAVTLNVGETQKWAFTGVIGYNAAGAATKKWNSSDPAVVSVNNGVIKANKVGTADITLQLTNNGIQYAGKTTVTVVDPKAAGTGKIKQTAYDTIVITFDTEEEAKAAKETVKIERVKISGKGKPFYLNVGSKPTVKDNTIVVSKLAKDVTYQVTVNGKAENITLSYGDPAYVVLSYADAYIGAGYDLLGNKITAPTTTPELKVYDEDDIELERTGTVKYTYDKNKSYKVTFTSGKVKFQDANSYATVKAVYTYKVGTVNKTLEDEVRIAPLEYVAPNLGGFVESITLTDKKGDKVVYPSDYNFSAELNIKQSLDIAYYFQDQNGKKYCGKEVAGTVKYDNGIAELGSKEVYYFVKDDPDKTYVSLGTIGSSRVTVKGWNEGTERICLYKQLGTSQKPETDILVGVIDITVNEEAKTNSFGLEEDSFELYRGSLISEYQKKEIKFKLEDQYNQEIASTVKVTDENGNAIDWITSDAATTPKKEGKITINMSAAGSTDIEGKTIKLVSGDGYEETITVSVLGLDTAKGVRDYSVEAKPYNLTNAVIASTTLNDKVGAAITVVENIDGYPYQYKDFRVVSNADFDGAPTGAADNFYVVILNSDDQVVSKHRADNAVIPTSGQNPVATASFLFDGFATSAGVTSSLSEMLTTGNFTAVLYKTDSTTAGDFSTQSSAEFEMTNKANLVSSFDNFYELEIKDEKVVQVKSDGKPVQAVDVHAETATSDTQYDTLVRNIVGQMYGWFDKNADGKAQAGEVDKLSVLFNNKDFEVSDMKYVKGAENDEVYVKSVKISYQPLGHTDSPIVEQVITINQKYDFTKSN